MSREQNELTRTSNFIPRTVGVWQNRVSYASLWLRFEFEELGSFTAGDSTQKCHVLLVHLPYVGNVAEPILAREIGTLREVMAEGRATEED